MAKVETVDIGKLRRNSKNHNKGTARGEKALRDSMKRHKAGRSILVDKHGVAIAGNHALDAAAATGIKKVIVVETDGTELVAVKRTDLSAADATAIELAYSDNRTQELDFVLDLDQLQADLDSGIDLSGLYDDAELDRMLAGLEKTEYQPRQIIGNAPAQSATASAYDEAAENADDDSMALGYEPDEDDAEDESAQEPEPAKGTGVNGERFPLAIVLSWAELQNWKALKEALGERSDKKVLLRLMETMSDG